MVRCLTSIRRFRCRSPKKKNALNSKCFNSTSRITHPVSRAMELAWHRTNFILHTRARDDKHWIQQLVDRKTSLSNQATNRRRPPQPPWSLRPNDSHFRHTYLSGLTRHIMNIWCPRLALCQIGTRVPHCKQHAIASARTSADGGTATTSGARPARVQAAAVVGPIAATTTLDRILSSPPSAMA